MRISEVASILGQQSKDVIAVVEDLREELTARGFKLAKRLTASSGLDEDAVRFVMAALDKKRQEELHEQEAAEAEKRRAEEEKRRAEEAERRRIEEEERRRQAEEARKRADEELERRRRALAAATAAAGPPAPTAPTVEPAPTPPSARFEQPQAPAAPAAPAPAPPSPAVRRDEGEQRGRERGPAEAARAGRGDRDRRSDRADRGRGERRELPGPLSTEDLQAFVDRGMEPELKDERPSRRRDSRRDQGKGAPGGEAPRRRRARTTGEPGAKRFRPTQIFKGDVVSRTAPRASKGARMARGGNGRPSRHGGTAKPKEVVLNGDFTVGQFADRLGVPASEVMQQLFTMGQLLTINQVLDPDLAELIAAEMGVDVKINPEGDEYDIEQLVSWESGEVSGEEVLRPPVVTIMGHVDHGKTTLLDYIRKTDVAEGEHGGITQHIGAYHVNTPRGDIAFLDTPGHEAFTAMRARGANVTDLVVLIVAANDGVKPQTVEAINHAKAADVPIIVAVNKIDVDGANPQRVRQELMAYELVSEELGGETIMVDVSAITGQGVPELLEMIALQAEILELTANPERPAEGTIVESHVDTHRGAVATVLVEEGTLKPGDVFVCGTEFGRVRAMRDDRGKAVGSAGPSTPVEIMGLSGSPQAGEKIVVVPDEATAREIAERRMFRRRERAARAQPHVTLETLVDQAEGDVGKVLRLIVKGDVQGSVEAIQSALLNIKSDKVTLDILHTGVGPISEGDVSLADASDAIIVGFNVRPDTVARDLISRTGVEVKLYNVIYELLEEIEAAMKGMLEPVYEEVTQSRSNVKQVFRTSRFGNVAGCLVEEGTVGRDHHAHVVRDGTVVWTGRILGIRRVKDDVREVQAGVECGISLRDFNDIKEGDTIESFTLKQLEATLVSPSSSSGR